ncbi:hypothetical protein FRC02_001373, partial [Tulasnella sp. 418]
PYRVGSYSIENWPVHPDYVGYCDAIVDDFVVRPLPVYTRGMAHMLHPTEYLRIVGCTVLASYCVIQSSSTTKTWSSLAAVEKETPIVPLALQTSGDSSSDLQPFLSPGYGLSSGDRSCHTLLLEMTTRR